MKNFITILIIMVMSFSLSAQSWVELSTGTAADTLIESTTFSKTFKVVSKETPTVAIQLFVDSVSGTPSGTATLYQSLDNVNWETTGQAVVYTTGVDTSFYVTDTTFYGLYGKIGFTATATGQRSLITATKMQWNKR